ncbi:MAG: serine protease [Desulfuromonadales bacterium C00003096]|nr:MAG: serine protease [Desulfuromonadales bacterium C00003096]
MAEEAKLPRELIVIAKPDVGLRTQPATEGRVASVAAVNVTPLSDLLKSEDVILQPLFGLSEERMLDRTASLEKETGEKVPDLSGYYHVEAPDEHLDGLAESLNQLDVVEAAYVKPPGEPPMATDEEMEVLNDMQPRSEEPPVVTPDFTSRQIYLNAAPAGIDARHAWTLSGGRGAGVKIIDCEWGWHFTHEDLLQNQMGVVIGTSLSYSSDPTADTNANKAVNHGTAVLGVISGDRNAFGITGICPDAIVGAARFGNSAQTVRQAADKLLRGDIILLEIHRPGPRNNYQSRLDQRGYIAIEWWPDDFDAIRYAISKGIIVVEAAGNGAENLDDALYNTRPAGFPASWRNPFNPANPSSSAVVVGAGAPPPGTHGRNHGPDRSRLGFSNYGARIDCQGWGREVTTTGYGDLQGGSSIHTNEWYTDRFSGTSSASPIVVGALGCVQGILRAQGGTLLTPAKAISLLRSNGSPQQDAPGRPRTQRIGNRPNLRQLIPAVADAWQYNKRVIRTHAKNGSQMGWAIIEGSSWLRVRPKSADGVTNVFVILCEALANNRRADVYVRNGQIEQATLR